MYTLAAVFAFVISYYALKHLDTKTGTRVEVLGYSIIAPSVTLAPTLIPTPTPSSTPTLTPTPVPTATLTPTTIPTPTSVLQPVATPQEINSFIERFAGQYGVDPNVLRHIATCESEFRANAVNGPYVGLYQFSSPTWNVNRVMMGEDVNPDLRANAEEAVQTAAYMFAIGRGNIWPNCIP